MQLDKYPVVNFKQLKNKIDIINIKYVIYFFLISSLFSIINLYSGKIKMKTTKDIP